MKIMDIRADWLDGETPDGAAILRKVALMGRICYQSEGKTSDADFVRRLIERGHESVLEHATLSVVLTCDRGVTHELVRHRVASYSQESTRYCNYSKGKFGGVACIDISEGMRLDPKVSKLPDEARLEIFTEWLHACQAAEKSYLRLLELGASPQIARSVLNNSTKTQIGITMNLREWRHFFRLRCDKAAHPQMRDVAGLILEKFRAAVPVIFDDLEGVQNAGDH